PGRGFLQKAPPRSLRKNSWVLRPLLPARGCGPAGTAIKPQAFAQGVSQETVQPRRQFVFRIVTRPGLCHSDEPGKPLPNRRAVPGGESHVSGNYLPSPVDDIAGRKALYLVDRFVLFVDNVITHEASSDHVFHHRLPS